MATPLVLKEVLIEALRCHTKIKWLCSPGINLVVGENGCGKTTLLEAVNLMAQGRSFRQARDPELVRRGEKSFKITGRWQRYGPLHVAVEGQRRKTEVSMQGKPIQCRSELFQTLPVIADAPHARRLVDGAPVERRHWLDAVIMSCRQAASGCYKRYFRSVMQRNRLLRRGVTSSELEAWEQQIASYAQKIVTERAAFIDKINTCLAKDEELTEVRLSLSIQTTGPEEAGGWLEMLHKQRHEDARLGSLRRGPHCDRLRIDYQGREIRSAGSRGQQKLALMALRLAEQHLWSKYRGIVPVLLLDDCLEALDMRRQQRLLARLEETKAQALLTAPNSINLPKGVNIERYELATEKAAGLLVPAYMNVEEAA